MGANIDFSGRIFDTEVTPPRWLSALLRPSAFLRDAGVRSQLRALRRRMDPVILRNTSTIVARLAAINPPRADALSKAMATFFSARIAGNSQEWVTLADEFELARDYLALHQDHADGAISVHIDASPGCESLKLPSMLLLPLIENAVLHGVADARQALWIWVTARLDQNAQGADELTVEVTNRTIEDLSVAKPRPGLGLAGTAERLAVSFGLDAQLHHRLHSPGCFVARIRFARITRRLCGSFP